MNQDCPIDFIQNKKGYAGSFSLIRDFSLTEIHIYKILSLVDKSSDTDISIIFRTHKINIRCNVFICFSMLYLFAQNYRTCNVCMIYMLMFFNGPINLSKLVDGIYPWVFLCPKNRRKSCGRCHMYKVGFPTPD